MEKLVEAETDIAAAPKVDAKMTKERGGGNVGRELTVAFDRKRDEICDDSNQCNSIDDKRLLGAPLRKLRSTDSILTSSTVSLRKLGKRASTIAIACSSVSFKPPLPSDPTTHS